MKNMGVLPIHFILLFTVGLTHAEPITIQIGGYVTSASGSALPSTIYDGVPFTGSYTYNSSTSDSDSNPQFGEYLHDSPYGISISLGGYEFKTASSHTGHFEMRIWNDVVNDTPQDYYTVFSDENVSVPALGSPIDYIGWYLVDYDHTALSSDVLPVTVPELTDWEYNYFEIHGWDSTNSIWIRGTVTEVAPEPVTGIFLLIGSFILRGGRRTKVLN